METYKTQNNKQKINTFFGHFRLSTTTATTTTTSTATTTTTTTK